MEFVDLSNAKDPESGKTYREINQEKKHNIPLGSLVETSIVGNEYTSGMRLWVVLHDRDFDGTPLYGLSFKRDWQPCSAPNFEKLFRMQVDGGYPEECLTIIEKVVVISEIQQLLNDWMIDIRYVDILNRWNEPHRFYHNMEHLNDLFRQIKNAFDDKEYDKLIYEKLLLIALFHDIIYDPLSSDNEEASAEFFLHHTEKHCLDIMDIRRAILDTKNHDSDNELSEIFNEFDMKIIERDYTSLLVWEEGIYNEYKSCGNILYKQARIEFLKKMVLKYPNNSENLNMLIDFVEKQYI